MTQKTPEAMSNDWSWWRFSAYRIVGRLISPAPGAKLMTYRPIQSFADWQSDTGDGEPPYLSLLNLVRRTNKDQPQDGGMSPIELQDEWLAWFTQNGLFGLLPHQLHRLTYPAPVSTTTLGRRAEGAGFLTYYREFGEWRSNWSGRADGSGLSVVRLGGDSFAVEHLMDNDADAFLNRYLDQTKGAPSDLPLPESESFWTIYREPWGEAFMAASLLHDAATAWANPSTRDRDNIDTLERLLEGVRFRIHEYHSGGRLALVYPSLLSALAYMIANDLTNRRLFLCPECGTFFVSKAYQSNFCSKKCRSRSNTREFRRRQKAIRMKHEGYSEAQIAEQLEITRPEVKDLLAVPLKRKLRKVGADGYES